MMFKSPILSSLAITTIALATTHTNISYAAASFGPPVRATVHLNAPTNHSHKSAFLTDGSQTPAQQENKTIMLMNLNLTAKDKHTVADQVNFVKNLDNNVPTNDASLPSRVDLGMGNVPVLDQGDNGTCVTFATTAAMNAVLNKGHYISQLCSLELGSYLANRSHGPSGWDGSFANRVLANFTQFGIVTIDQQRANSCGGLREYPGVGMDIGKEMSLEDYHKISIPNPLHWYSLLTMEQRFYSNTDVIELTTNNFNNVKKILASADAKHPLRIVIGVIVAVDHCDVGACGKYHEKNDTWALTKTIIKDLMTGNYHPGGHEVVLTGYDDNAVAIDNEGGRHKGLFFLRNSWSDRAGDKGNYYMTYDYFRVLVDEATVIAAGPAGNGEASN